MERLAENPAHATTSLDAKRMRGLIDAALSSLDSDETKGSALAASDMRVRLQVRDLDLQVDVEAASGVPGHYLRWGFDEETWEPKLSLSMDSDTANAYLQGRESLVIAIARGRVRLKGESRVALLYLPLLRLIVEPYRRAVEEREPALAL